MRCRSSPTSAPRIPRRSIDWVVEPAFAPLLGRVDGIAEVIELRARRWSQERLAGARRRAARSPPSSARLRRQRYDAVIDLQGLTKSALVSLPRARPELRPGESHRGREPRVAGALAGDARDPGRAAQPCARPLARAGGARPRHARPSGPPAFGLAAGRGGRRRTAHASSSSTAPRAPTSSGPRRAGSSSAAGWSPPAGRSPCRARAPRRRRAPSASPPRSATPRGLAGDGPRRAHRSPGGDRRRDRRRQRAEPHRRRARPAARADLQPSDRLAHRAAGAAMARAIRSRSKAGRRRTSTRSGPRGSTVQAASRAGRDRP